MMRSLFSGVSGLRVHQTKMDVLGNNISNINTVGFKAGRVTFTEMFNQKISGATRSNEDSGRGGTNAMQIGLGVNIGAINVVMSEGANQRTDRGLDLKINGDGFFIVGDNTTTNFTRAGNFDLDDTGALLLSGMHVMGWPSVPSSTRPGSYEIQKGTVEPLYITSANNMYSNPEITEQIDFEGNIDPTDTTQIKKNMTFFDSLGNRYTLGTTFIYDDESKVWDLRVDTRVIMNGDTDNPIYLNIPGGAFNDATSKTDVAVEGTDQEPTADSISVLRFQFNEGSGEAPFAVNVSTDGVVTPIPNSQPLKLNLQFAKDDDTGIVSGFPMEVVLNDIEVNLGNIKGFNSNTTINAETVNGNVAGILTGFDIGEDGIIVGKYSNGDTKPLGQIAVARFKNPAGLEKLGNNLYSTTPNSGDFDGVGEECYASGGSLSSGFLEMSNVDLSSEFTEMITTQRGFQANSRIITTSDEMLQELVNLKR